LGKEKDGQKKKSKLGEMPITTPHKIVYETDQLLRRFGKKYHYLPEGEKGRSVSNRAGREKERPTTRTVGHKSRGLRGSEGGKGGEEIKKKKKKKKASSHANRAQVRGKKGPLRVRRGGNSSTRGLSRETQNEPTP